MIDVSNVINVYVSLLSPIPPKGKTGDIEVYDNIDNIDYIYINFKALRC